MTNFRRYCSPVAIFASVFLLVAPVTSCQHAAISQPLPPPKDAPQWTHLKSLLVKQEGPLLSFTLEAADSIPRSVADSCQFQILINSGLSDSRKLVVGDFSADFVIGFDLTHWDGSPWFAASVLSGFAEDGRPADTARMFDWKLGANTLKVRFSLHGLAWSTVKAKARVFFKSGWVAATPDSGYVSANVDRSVLQTLRSVSRRRTRIVYPEGFDSLLTRYGMLDILDEAYDCERELTGVRPVGGDSVRYVFNAFYDGAAIEGDPISLGPGMWGNRPQWFVYFHELGHNYMNVSARFRQLYPLEMNLPPGPLPTNILYYEAWASLPAMYVFERLERWDSTDQALKSGLADARREWSSTKGRFERAWSAFKEKPTYSSLNPDVVDGMFLELKDRFGWEMFRRFFALMRPPNDPLELFNARLEGDSRDLRTSRTTLTIAALSASAGSDLRPEFTRWGFPIDDQLFASAFAKLSELTR